MEEVHAVDSDLFADVNALRFDNNLEAVQVDNTNRRRRAIVFENREPGIEMDSLPYIFFVGLGIYSLTQIVFVTAYFFRNHRAQTIALPDEKLPKAAVVVSLRGADPFLLDSLKRLLQQDYPRYEVRFVIDSRHDPAWAVAEQAIRETVAGHASIEEFLNDPNDGIINCTNAKAVQAVRRLDDSVEIIAMMDGDAMPGSLWLRDLVAPLVIDKTIGATYGNRWFLPERGGWGSMCRFVWNAASVPPMDLLKMPWGGCFAIRADAVRAGKLVDQWARQIALDAASKGALEKQGLGLKFVPQLMMVNTEECSLSYCVNFVRRQLTWTMLYHSNGALALFKPIAVAVVFLGTVFSAIWNVAQGSGAIALAGFGSLAFYVFSSLGCLLTLDYTIRRLLRARGDAVPGLSTGRLLRAILMIPGVVGVEFLAALQAACLRRVSWRGLKMEIADANDIRIIQDDGTPDRRSSGVPTSC